MNYVPLTLRQKVRFTLLTVALVACSFGTAQPVSYPNSGYQELIRRWQELASRYSVYAKWMDAGPSDSGLPIHLFVVDASGSFSSAEIHTSGKAVVLVLNGIHPGEPDGMEASLVFAERLLQQPPAQVVYCFIPVYNVGGMLQRSATFRANQNGPFPHGFRGNARNLDLNRDFVKCDSRNARTFASVFHTWKPHVLIDTHVSNGADYQHTMTLVNTVPEKLDAAQGHFLSHTLLPAVYRGMEQSGNPMVPYVDLAGPTPEHGIEGFLDLPRYSTGYAALFNTIGFMSETHMLKPYDNRVEATIALMHVLDTLVRTHAPELVRLKAAADARCITVAQHPTAWRRTEGCDSIPFLGYRADSVTSAVTTGKRLIYDRSRPYRDMIPYYNRFEPTHHTKLPMAYVIPGAWREVAELLSVHGVVYRTLLRDTTITLRATYIDSYDTYTRPYEGHYVHYNVKKSMRTATLTFRAGDLVVPTAQTASRFLAWVMDPISADAFFNWNFFDAVLGQKEYFSAYVFEDIALSLLDSQPGLARNFREKLEREPDFSRNPSAQLDYIYRNSPWYEPTHNRLPVYEIPD